MKTPSVLRLSLFLLASLAISPFNSSFAQMGRSSMSVGMTRAGVPIRASDLRVEEFVNYHRHDLRIPKSGEPVSFSLKWLRKSKTEGLLQIGLATPNSHNLKKLPPLNLVLVIDKSGSMSGDRINNVKSALTQLVSRLREGDKLSIVLFNHHAETLFSGKCASDKNQILAKIESIQANGSTNIHSGLMTGYTNAMEHFDKEKSNRVLLLTDGLTNTGVVDTEQIANDSAKYNKKGIELSTIGLGNNFNKELLRALSDGGKGQAHFVSDSKDIRKTFQKELDSILATSATDVSLTLQFEDLPEPATVYGYGKKVQDGNTITIPLDNFTFGSTSVVLVKTSHQLENDGSDSQVTATLNYKRYMSPKNQSISLTSKFNEHSGQVTTDRPVLKNLTIAELAQGLQTSIKLVEKRKLQKARKTLKKAISKANKRFPETKDKDILRIKKKCKEILKTFPAKKTKD